MREDHVKKIALRKGNDVVERLCIKLQKKSRLAIVCMKYTVGQPCIAPTSKGFRSLRQAESAFNKQVKALVASGYTVLSAWTLNFHPSFGIGQPPMLSTKGWTVELCKPRSIDIIAESKEGPIPISATRIGRVRATCPSGFGA